MSIFFQDFPKIEYDFWKQGKYITITNTTKRFAPLKEILNKSILYYDYEIGANQRPDTVSHMIYGSVDYEWILFMFNEIFDPYYQWPLSYNEFKSYLEVKYGSVEASTQLIKEYRYITTPYQKLDDGTIIQERSLVIDQSYYSTLPDYERKIIYAYDYEVEKNNSRSRIKLLDPVYLPQINAEKQKIFK